MIKHIEVHTFPQRLRDITTEINKELSEAGVAAGLCTVTVQNTSTSLVIADNADAFAKSDLEADLNSLFAAAKVSSALNEGDEDRKAYLRSVMTGMSISIPVVEGRLALRSFQSLFLWEHRTMGSKREFLMHVISNV